MPDIFYVTDRTGNLVAAKYLQINSNYIVDPNVATSTKIYDQSGNLLGLNTNNYLIVPSDYSINSAINLAAEAPEIYNTPELLQAMVSFFETGGPGDLQRTYNGLQNQTFVGAFTDAASYNLGLVTEMVGLPLIAAEIGGGALNLKKFLTGDIGSSQLTWAFGNGPGNSASMTAGFAEAGQLEGTGDTSLTPVTLSGIGVSNLTATVVPISATIAEIDFPTGLDLTLNANTGNTTASYNLPNTSVTVPTSDVVGITSGNYGAPALQLTGAPGADIVAQNNALISIVGVENLDYDPLTNEYVLKYGLGTPGTEIVTTTLSASGGSGTLNANQPDGTAIAQSFATTAQEFGQVGGAFGSAMGNIIGGSNPFASIGASTVLGALGTQAAAAIGVLGDGADISQTIDTFLDGTTGPAGGPIGSGGLLSNLEGQGAGAVAGYFLGELFSDLGLNGPANGIVSNIASQEVVQIAKNIVTLGASAWDSGIDLDDIGKKWGQSGFSRHSAIGFRCTIMEARNGAAGALFSDRAAAAHRPARQ